LLFLLSVSLCLGNSISDVVVALSVNISIEMCNSLKGLVVAASVTRSIVARIGPSLVEVCVRAYSSWYWWECVLIDLGLVFQLNY